MSDGDENKVYINNKELIQGQNIGDNHTIYHFYDTGSQQALLVRKGTSGNRNPLLFILLICSIVLILVISSIFLLYLWSPGRLARVDPTPITGAQKANLTPLLQSTPSSTGISSYPATASVTTTITPPAFNSIATVTVGTNPTTPPAVPTNPIIAPPTPIITTPAIVSATATAASSLIPNSGLVLNDPLTAANDSFKWDTGQQGSATCTFIPRATYAISAPAKTGNLNGGECNTETTNTNFTNFVYQIKMIINQGLNGQGGAGPSFCVSSQSGGSLYGVSFDTQGNWTFGLLLGGNYTPYLGNQNQSFVKGTGQANYITVRVQGHHIDAQINGTPLFSTTDTTLNGGMIGVQLGPGNANAAVAFSDARVWQLP